MTLTHYISRARVEVPRPERTLLRLCKHFSHKVEARWDQSQGFVDFAIGTCALRAESSHLHLECESGTPAGLGDIEQTLERHLGPMSGLPAEAITITWMRPSPE